MSRVIKYNMSEGLAPQIGAYRARGTASHSALSNPSFLGESISPEQRALEIVYAQNEDLRDQITQMKSQLQNEIEAAYQKGKLDAQSTFINSESAATQVLITSVHDALDGYQLKLKQLDKTALIATEVVLDHLFSDAANIRMIVEQKLLALIAKFGDNMVLGISVSAADFSDQESLRTIARLSLDSRVNITISNNLVRGSFEIELRLGHLEFSLADSLGEVKALFNDVIAQGDME